MQKFRQWLFHSFYGAVILGSFTGIAAGALIVGILITRHNADAAASGKLDLSQKQADKIKGGNQQ